MTLIKMTHFSFWYLTMELLQDDKQLQIAAKVWGCNNKYIRDIADQIETQTADPTSVETWLPLIYWLIKFERQLYRNRMQKISRREIKNPRRKVMYRELRTAIKYCPL